MPEDPVTLGELSRRLDAFEHRIDGEFAKLGRSIDALKYVHVDQYRAERDALIHRLDELEERDRWKVRALVTAFLYPLVLAAIGAFMLGGGL